MRPGEVAPEARGSRVESQSRATSQAEPRRDQARRSARHAGGASAGRHSAGAGRRGVERVAAFAGADAQRFRRVGEPGASTGPARGGRGAGVWRGRHPCADAGVGLRPSVARGGRGCDGPPVVPAGCPAWAEDVAWRQADATAWLRGQRGGFACVLEDLSELRDGDVHKPADCRRTLPRLIGRRLGRGGVAVFNVVPDADGSWPGMAEVLRLFPCVLEVRYAEYLNRTLAAGTRLPGAGCVGAMAAGGPAADGIAVGRTDAGGNAHRPITGSVRSVAVLARVRATWATSRPWCGCRAWWPG